MGGFLFIIILVIDFNDTKQKMEKSFQVLREEVASIRTGRAMPVLIENVVCLVYQGTQNLRVKELASITVGDPQTLVIQPWDGSIISEIKNGILAANVGLTPVVDGGVIRIAVPAMTSERREEYVKLLGQKTEESKVAIRNVRRDKMVEIKGQFDNKGLSENEKFQLETELQKLTDGFVGKIDELAKKKGIELLQV